MRQKVILSVPADFDYLQTVENFADILFKHFALKFKDEKLEQNLRSTVNEAFVNVLQHTPMPQGEWVNIVFELGESDFVLRFPDQGRGIPIRQHYPPYPSHLIGSEHLILKTLDGYLYGRVETPTRLKLEFKSRSGDKAFGELLKDVSDGGMGLSIIVKTMDEVRFVWDENRGNSLEIKKRLHSKQT